MSKKIKDEQKKLLGQTLNEYDKTLKEGIKQLDKKNREQNHKISALTNSFDNDFLEKEEEGTMISLENSKDGMVIIDEIAGNSEVNYCKDGVTELTLNGDIDTQGERSVTITEGVDGGLVDVVLEGNTEINMSNTKDSVMVTHMFDEFTNNGGKLQTTVDDVTTYDSMVGKIDIKNIKGDTLVNHAVNGNEELILSGNIDVSGDNFITIDTCAEGGKVDVVLEGNTMVNVCDQKDPVAITKSYTVETGNHVALQGEYDGKCRPVVTGNTLWIDNATGEVLTAFDDSKDLRLQSSFEDKVVTQEMVDNGEESVENLGKYKVDYVISREDGTVGQTKTFYLNSPLLEGDTIEQSGNNVIHVHRYDKVENIARVIETVTENNNNYEYLADINCVLYKISDNYYDKYVYSDKLSSLNDVVKPYEKITGANQIYINKTSMWVSCDKNKTTDEFISFINSCNIIAKLATPQYEVISQNDTILCDSYVNGHLDVDSVVPIEKVVFKEPNGMILKYLYPSTNYNIQFEADNTGKCTIALGGRRTSENDIVKGINKITASTHSLPNRFMFFYGIGFNASNIVVTEATDQDFGYFEGMKSVGECENNTLEIICKNNDNSKSNTQTLTHEPLRVVGNVKDRYVLIDGKWYIERNCGVRAYQEGDIDNYITDMVNTVYPLSTPTYEPINYNTFTVYSDTTHISNNSTIPCNMTIKNHGYNMVALKENTQYTLYVDKNTTNALTYRLGDYVEINSLSKFTFTTPATLTDKTLRITGKGNSVKDLMLIEGTPANDPVGYFNGLKSSYECEKVTDELDENYGKYKVETIVKCLDDELFESKQTVYLNSPLLKGDEIVWKDNKIQHYHIMGSVVFDGSNDENWGMNIYDNVLPQFVIPLNNKRDTSYPLLCDNILSKDGTLGYGVSLGYECITTHDYGEVLYIVKNIDNVIDFKQWLQQNPVTVVYQLATPYYEEISPYPLKFNTKENCSLTTESNIQVTQISFNIYEETLAYLYPSTKYYVSFNADISREIVVDLGGTKSRFTTQVGYNKIEITTPADITNMLTFNGQGINIDHVKVTRQDIDEYFEGMKSVGECENNTLEIICKNNDNSKSNTQTLTHEPLRVVGNVKDRYVLIDGKWYIERNCGEIILDETRDWIYGGYGGLTNGDTKLFEFSVGGNAYTNELINLISDSFIPVDAVTCWSTDIECIALNSIGLLQLRIKTSRLTEESVNGLKAWLTSNNVKCVYPLSTSQYEPINYNPFEVYSDITHISNNSLIPSNMIIKNHGYNTILKPSTKYTVALNKSNGMIGVSLGGSSKVESSNNVFTITTPSTLTDNCLRLYGKGIKSRDVMILEGDKTNYIPGYFEGLESAFEQEYDEEVGKYKVKIKVVGKNFINLNEILSGSTTGYNTSLLNIPLSLKKGTYTISFSNIEEPSSSANIIKVCDYNNPSDTICTVLRYSKKTTFILAQDTDVDIIYIPRGSYTLTGLQLEQGAKATTYEPYKESIIEFYIDEPLRRVGEVKDKVFIQDSKVIIERNCEELSIDTKDVTFNFYNASDSNSIGVHYDIPNILNVKQASYYVDSIPCLTNAPFFGIYPDGSGIYVGGNNMIGMYSKNDKTIIVFKVSKKDGIISNSDDLNNYLKTYKKINIIYPVENKVYEEVDYDSSKLVLENYSNSSLILDTNIPPTVDVRYSGEVPIVSQAKTLSSNIESTTIDINENIIPYMCDMDYRIIELQLNGDTQGEGIELLGIGDIEILGNENVLFNNREVKKYNFSYDMLKRDIISNRYSKEEYQYRLDRYLLAEKISDEEYKELEGLLNNGE